MIHEWHWIGEVCLQIKELWTFESETILSLFNIFTSTNKKILLAELHEIFTEAQSQAQEHDATEFWWSSEDTSPKSTLPAFKLCLVNPKLLGQDVSHFNKLSWWIQTNRKVYHIECDHCFAKDIQHLMHYAKELDLVTKYWGCQAHVSKVVDKSSSPSKIKRLIQVAQCHTNYQCSMILEDISGIVDLNGSAAVKDEETSRKIMTITLRTVLLKYLRLSDGHQLIAEIHQSKEPMAPVQAVLPNTPEAEHMIVMMNKNFPSYVGNFLKDQGPPEEFLMEFFRQSCCQTMIAKITLPHWNSDRGTLTTAKELALDKTTADLEEAAWFKDAFSALDIDKSKGTRQPAPPPEALFDLDGKWSIKTIHEHHMHRITTTTGSPPPKKGTRELVDMAGLDNEDSASSPDDEGLHEHSNQGVDGSSSTSSAEEGQEEHAADGGQLPPASLLHPQGGHSNRRQVICQYPGAGSIIRGIPHGGGTKVGEHLCLGEAIE